MKNALQMGILAWFIVGCSQPHKPDPANTFEPQVHEHITSYATVLEQVQSLNQKYGTDQVLVVLDIDNTILTSDVDLGGDVWYQWQRGRLQPEPTEAQQVDCLFEDAIGVLYELGTMSLTEPDLPAWIKAWQQGGNAVFALTSRSPKYRAATERELQRYGIDFTPTALRPEGAELPVLSGMLERPYSYIRGIMMTTGMNKGTMLQHILQTTGRDFKAIVFVDDSKKNVDNLQVAYADSPVEMHIVHYTKVEADRVKTFGTVLTQDQADKMAADWTALQQTLKQVFPGRDVAGACVGS